MSARCRSCQQEIVWAITAAGKRMPVDATPTPAGNLVLEEQGIDTPVVCVVRPDPTDSRPRYTSHFATCPDRAGWRKL